MLVNAAMQEMNSKNFVASSMHRRTKSEYSEKRVKNKEGLDSSKVFQHLKLGFEKAKGYTDTKKKSSHVKSPLKREIQQLEKRLKDQLSERCALERAMGYRPSVIDSSDNNSSMTKPTKELIREIAVLEVEVMALEQYLLSLYREAFDQQVCTSSTEQQPVCSLQPGLLDQEGLALGSSSKRKNSVVNPSQTPKPRSPAARPVGKIPREKLTGPGVHRCQSALSHRALHSSRMSPSEDSVARALQTCHSQPLNFFEDGQSTTTSGFVSLAEYLGTSIVDHISETPNMISEGMVRCMGAIYCKLADPPLVQRCIPSSPTSSFSSTSALSPGDMWSPGNCRRESNLDARLINPFRVEGMKEFSGPYNAMVEVPSICRDPQRLSEVEGLLQNYKSLVSRLETVDPRKMRKEEKLTFWINVHNALIMHAYLVHGVPIRSTKNESLLVKAMCVVGGRSVSAHTIQLYILGCRAYFPGQWFRSLLSPRMKLKTGGEWRSYGIETPEPLLHFALCSGSHSDPAVRVYTCKKLFQQLEAAKEEYIRATVGIRNEEKILLPKVIDSYAKDTNMSPKGVVDMIKHHLPSEALRIAMQRCQQQQERPHKVLEWVPHNFAFRYLLSKELVIPHIS